VAPCSFDAVVSADKFARLKPAPDIFLAASQELGVPQAQVCLMGALAWTCFHPALSQLAETDLRCPYGPGLRQSHLRPKGWMHGLRSCVPVGVQCVVIEDAVAGMQAAAAAGMRYAPPNPWALPLCPLNPPRACGMPLPWPI